MTHLGRGRRVLFLDMLVSQPDQHASSVRAVQLLTMLRDWGWEVDFLNWFLAEPPAPTTALEQLGVRPLPRAQMPELTDIEAFLTAEAPKYDLIYLAWVVLARRLLPLLRQVAPGRPLLYDSHDVNYLREYREARLTGNARTLARSLRTKEAERQALTQADAALAITPADTAKLHELVPQAKLFTVGMWSDPLPLERRPEPATLLFLGNMGAPHNHDCALFLAREVMPLLRPQPGLRLLLAGPAHNELAAKIDAPDVAVLDWVPDLAPLFARATAMVAPLRFGSGLKGKMLQAMARGTPIVASAIAAEGMPLTDGRDYLRAEGAEAVAAAVRRLLDAPAEGERLAAAALQTLKRHYGRPAMEAPFAAALASVMG